MNSTNILVNIIEKVWYLGRSLFKVQESKYIRDFMTELMDQTEKNSFYLIVNCSSVFFLKKEYCLCPIL